MNKQELENRIVQISNQLIADKGFVCSIDVLRELNYLNETQIKNWRIGKVQYLEKVCGKNLGTLSFINKIIKEISKDLKLEPSWTAYNKFGKGVKTRLIFSKTRDENIENAYATHYLDTERIKELKKEKASL